MPIKIKSVDDMRRYFKAVVERGEHHGEQVKEALYPLAGFLFAYTDDNSDLKVKTYDGKAKNVIWFQINGCTYVMSYNHEDVQIDFRRDGLQGDTT